ncbi:MAG: tetratricopeptide repeat protein [Pseudonocardiaceae bacterium]
MPTQTPLRFTLDTGQTASYAIAAHPAQAYLWLQDFHSAKTHSEAALAVHESADGSSSPGKGSIARLDLAISLVHLGAPDEAAALGVQALASTSALGSVLAHARDLNSALVSCYPTLSCVQDFHEQYRQIVRRPAPSV